MGWCCVSLLHRVYAWHTMYASCWNLFWCFFSFCYILIRRKDHHVFILSQHWGLPEGAWNRKSSEMSLELGGGWSPKNAKGV